MGDGCLHDYPPGVIKTSDSQSTAVPTVTIIPNWFDIQLIDVQTGQPFSMNDYAGFEVNPQRTNRRQ